MYRYIFILLGIFILSFSNAQTPNLFTYQGVAIDQNQFPVKLKKISLKISILSENYFGSLIYSEIHTPITDLYGQFYVNVGGGSIINGKMNGLQWDRMQYFIKAEIDINGGNNYSEIGISQIYPIPYAIVSNSAGNTLIKLDTIKSNLSNVKILKRNDSLLLNNQSDGIYMQTVDSLNRLLDQVKKLQAKKLNYDSVIKILNKKTDSVSNLINWQNTTSIKSSALQYKNEFNTRNLDAFLLPSVSFDGVKTFVQIGSVNLGSLIAGKSFTIETWVKSLKTSDTSQVIFTSGIDGNGWVHFQVRLVNNKLVFQTYNNNRILVSTDFPRDTLWHHVAITVSEKKYSALFLDGVERFKSKNLGSWIATTPNITIGAFYNSNLKNETFFKGNLRKLRISKGVVYNADFSPSYSYAKTDSTLAFWELNEGSGTTINCSEPAYNGILYGGAWQISNPSLPSIPTVGTITQPTCTVSTGSVSLSGLPQTGTWTVTATGGLTKSGTGSATTFTGLAAGTYTFTVTNSEGFTSAASSSAVINAQPVSPSAPVVGTVTQPTTTVSTGSVALSGLPQTGTWTVTATGGSTKSGTGSTTTFTGLTAGTYTFTVTNSNGCTSAATASSTTINAAPTTLTNGLVVYYPFNGNANDTSGNANNGLVTRAALTTDRFGTANTAYSFDGSSTSIKIPFSSSINSIQKGLTVSAWIYMQGGTPAGNPPRLLELRGAYGNGGNAGFVLLSQGNSDSARTFETRWYNNNGATNISIVPTSSVTSKDWHHVVFTADGESAVGKFYVDGILRGTNAQIQNQGKIISCDYNSNAIFIGIEPGGSGAWGGKIDELRIYNRALDSNEVLYAFNAQNNTEPSNLKVGDSYGGGIIAYLLQPGDSGYSATVPHGIIVPPTDQGRLTYPWGCSGTLIGEISTNWGTGKTNTNKILAKCTAANTAAKLCDDLVLNGYTDWFLPSLGDLQKIRNLHQSGKGSFSTDLSYFTSSEVNAEVTYEYYISSGATGQVAKTLNLCVRAARYF